MGILIFIFAGLIAVFALFAGIVFFEELIFKKTYEKKNPTKKEDFEVFEDKASDEISRIYNRFMEWWNSRKLKKNTT